MAHMYKQRIFYDLSYANYNIFLKIYQSLPCFGRTSAGKTENTQHKMQH